MNMNMRIVMYMNIYITPKNERLLRDWHTENDDVTMSGLINKLLEEHFSVNEYAGRQSGTPPETWVSPKKLEPQTPKVDDLFADAEYICCKNENKPCKHWVWDSASGEGYVNILSGRKMEVE